jgi:hypothetical protein
MFNTLRAYRADTNARGPRMAASDDVDAAGAVVSLCAIASLVRADAIKGSRSVTRMTRGARVRECRATPAGARGDARRTKRY